MNHAKSRQTQCTTASGISELAEGIYLQDKSIEEKRLLVAALRDKSTFETGPKILSYIERLTEFEGDLEYEEALKLARLFNTANLFFELDLGICREEIEHASEKIRQKLKGNGKNLKEAIDSCSMDFNRNWWNSILLEP